MLENRRWVENRIRTQCARIGDEFDRRRTNEEVFKGSKGAAKSEVSRYRTEHPWQTAENYLRVALYAFGLSCLSWGEHWVEMPLIWLGESTSRKPLTAPREERFFHALLVQAEETMRRKKRPSSTVRNVLAKQLYLAWKCSVPVEHLLGFVSQTSRKLDYFLTFEDPNKLSFRTFYDDILSQFASKELKPEDVPPVGIHRDVEARVRRELSRSAIGASAKRASATKAVRAAAKRRSTNVKKLKRLGHKRKP